MNNYSIVGVILINAELGCVYLLLEEDSRAAGIVKLFSDGSKIEIASIYILEEFRGRGFGRKALEYIFSE